MASYTISQAEILRRQASLQSVLGTMAAEGEKPGAEAMSIFERYAAGELELTDVRRAIDELSRNLCSQPTLPNDDRHEPTPQVVGGDD